MKIKKNDEKLSNVNKKKNGKKIRFAVALLTSHKCLIFILNASEWMIHNRPAISLDFFLAFGAQKCCAKNSNYVDLCNLYRVLNCDIKTCTHTYSATYVKMSFQLQSSRYILALVSECVAAPTLTSLLTQLLRPMRWLRWINAKPLARLTASAFDSHFQIVFHFILSAETSPNRTLRTRIGSGKNLSPSKKKICFVRIDKHVQRASIRIECISPFFCVQNKV